MPQTADVVIAGAGPAGLLVAGDLAEAGVDVVVLDRRSAEQSNLTRAFVVSPRTLEQLDARGIADELVSTGSTLTEMRLYRRLLVDFAALPTRFPFELLTPQYQTEAVLRRRAIAAGARFAWQTEVTGVHQDADGVVVSVAGEQSGNWRAGYLVGADGVHSVVRKAVGEPFPGEVVMRSMMLADVRFAKHPQAVMRADATKAGFAFHVPFGDGWYRVICWNRHDEQPADAAMDLEEVRTMLNEVYGTDYGVRQARWMSRFQCDERQVAHYRIGRVVLVGDAAHTHTPSGAQGMNTGLQDAANLGWRLAAAVHGHTATDPLADYHRERHPVARRVIHNSGALMRVATTGSAALRAARLARLGGLSASRPAPRSVAAALSGIGIDYPATHGSDRTSGNRVPDLPLADDRRLYAVLRDRQFVLVRSRGIRKRTDLAARYGWHGPVTEVARADSGRHDLLVRPDGHLACAE